MRELKRKIKFVHRYLTAKERSLPDFFIAGTQKGGTTSLYTYLSQHPNIIDAFKKEVIFFKSPLIHKKGLRWYRSHFPTLAQKESENAIRGEATPLMYSLHAPRLIREVVPDVKLIFLLRNPVKRAFSHYQHNKRRKGREELTFSEAIRNENSRITKDIETISPESLYSDYSNRRYSYVYRGFYAEHLERWCKFFPDDQMFIEESEYFYANPQDCLEKITDFLDLPRYRFNCKSSHNIGGYSESILQTDLKYLKAVYKNHNEKLFSALGREFWTVPKESLSK